jgi:hypothetical protein
MNKSNFVDSLFTNEEIEEIDRWEEEKYRKNKSNFSDYKKIESLKKSQNKTSKEIS